MQEVSVLLKQQSDQSQVLTTEKQPIFILGILPRTGTNFLSNLLCLHPDCQKSFINEDYFVNWISYLSKYATKLTEHWAITADYSRLFDVKAILCKNLGSGLLSALYQFKREVAEMQAQELNFDLPEKVFNKRLVTKTPSVNNLSEFFDFFPQAQLLILIRDGRALVESNVKTFDLTHEEAIQKYVNAVRIIKKFERQNDSRKSNFLIVRYEELHLQTEREMRRIFGFLRLDVDKYDFKAALNLPIVGSSITKEIDGKVHWRPMQKTPEFNPLARAAGWSRAQHERFNWLAASEMKMLGYEPQTFSDNRFYWNLWNRMHDLKLKTNYQLIYLKNLLIRIKRKFWKAE